MSGMEFDPRAQWRSQDFPPGGGGGSAPDCGPTLCERGPQNYDPYFSMPFYRQKKIFMN